MRCPKSLIIGLIGILLSTVPFRAVAASPTPIITPGPRAEGTNIGAKIPALVGSLRITGYTSPNAVVTFLLEGVVVGTQISCPGGSSSICSLQGSNGYFDKTFTGIYPGTYNVGIYSQDSSSPSLSTPTVSRLLPIFNGEAKEADPITLPPTIKVDKLVMKRPELQTVRGMGRSNSAIKIFFDNANPFPQDTIINNQGVWNATNPEIQHLGNHFVTSFVQGQGGAISQISKIETYRVIMSADLNLDNQVDLLDFSMLMFNYDQTNPENWAADINDDALIDLSDFSIMMFNWTGEL